MLRSWACVVVLLIARSSWVSPRKITTCLEPIKHFDVQRYSHLWYLAYLSKNMENFPPKNCFEMKTEIFLNGTAIGINTFIPGKNLKKKVSYTPSKFMWTPHIGQYYVEVYGQILGPVNIIATDYDNYSLVWHCITKNPPDYPPVIIFTKEKHPSPRTRRRLDELMTLYQLKGKMVPIPECEM